MKTEELVYYLTQKFTPEQLAVLYDREERLNLQEYLERRIFLRARDVVIGGKKFRILPAATAGMGNIGYMLFQAENLPGRKIDQKIAEEDLLPNSDDVGEDTTLRGFTFLCTGWQLEDKATDNKIVMGIHWDPHERCLKTTEVLHGFDNSLQYRIIVRIED